MASRDALLEPDRLRVGLFGVLGSGNLGNDASLEVVFRHLRIQHPEAEIGFLAMGPEHLSRRYGAQATHLQWYEAHRDRFPRAPEALLKIVGRLMDPLRTWRWTRAYDVVIVPGMGVLESTTPTRPWGFPYGLLSLAVSARLSGTRLGLVCVGAEAGANGLTRWMFRSAARMASYRSYRDVLSRDAMRDLGVDVSHDQVFADLALALETPAPRAQPDLLGVGMMNFRGRSEDRPHAGAIHEQYAIAMEEAVRRLIAGGWRVLLLVGDAEDVPVVERLHARVARDAPPGSVDVATTHTFEELLEQIASTYLFMGTRYHNVLASLSLGTPTISIGYANKNDVLMERFGLGEFCQKARAVDVDLLCAQVAVLADNHKEVSATLRAFRSAVRAEVAQQLRSVSSDLLARELVTGSVGSGPEQVRGAKGQ